MTAGAAQRARRHRWHSRGVMASETIGPILVPSERRILRWTERKVRIDASRGRVDVLARDAQMTRREVHATSTNPPTIGPMDFETVIRLAARSVLPYGLRGCADCSTIASVIGFRVVMNGKQLVTAGLSGHHVLSAILSYVVRDPARGVGWPGPHAFVERELELSVSGLDSDRNQHVGWLGRALTVGDRIEIQIVDESEFDAPASRRPRRPSPEPPSKSKAPEKPARKLVRAKRPVKSATAVSQNVNRPRKK